MESRQCQHRKREMGCAWGGCLQAGRTSGRTPPSGAAAPPGGPGVTCIVAVAARKCSSAPDAGMPGPRGSGASASPELWKSARPKKDGRNLLRATGQSEISDSPSSLHFDRHRVYLFLYFKYPEGCKGIAEGSGLKVYQTETTNSKSANN